MEILTCLGTARINLYIFNKKRCYRESPRSPITLGKKTNFLLQFFQEYLRHHTSSTLTKQVQL